MSATVPYADSTKPSYAEDAAKSFSVAETTAHAVVLRGPCPRCGAVLEIPLVTSIFRGASDPAGTTFAGESDGKHVEPMACNCEHAHADRPEGTKGCGAYWNLVLEVDSE